jgi:hypothetical protein
MTTLYDILNAGYTNTSKTQDEFARKSGLVRDAELSNNKRQIYTSNYGKTLYHNINVIQTLADWKTNLMLGLGHGKNTERYEEEKGTSEKAKKNI